MNIAVIGSGNVGSALSKQFTKAGHRVYLGVRDLEDPKLKSLISENITAHSIPDAISNSEVIVIAISPSGVLDLVKNLGDVSSKIIIDAMNSFRADLAPYKTTAETLAALTNCKDIAKCFNTTGANNMENPNYDGQKIDAFVAGDSKLAKETASKLAKEIGFGEVYDLGGNDKFEMAEQIAMIWINLAMMQNYGRDIALKILKK